MLSFRGWVHEEVSHRRKYLPGVGHEVVDITFDTIRAAAEHRGCQALIDGLGAQGLYNQDPTYRAAMEQIVRVVVAGVFGEFPLTKQEQATKLKALDVLLQGMAVAGGVAESWAVSLAPTKSKQASPVTVESVMKAVEGVKAAKAGKSGLPAAQDAVKAEEDALGQLLGRVEAKSDELLGIKQKAKYEELVGVDPEDI